MAEAAAKSSEQEAMLERLLTRLALTEDSKLEPVLTKLLPYAISCLDSPQPSTKQKVMDMLTHINKRVKEQLDIKLPLQELLKLYRSENVGSMVKSFSLIYLEMAFDRRSKEEPEVGPDLLVGISKLAAQHQDIVLRIVIKEMEHYASGCINDDLGTKYSFANTPADRDIFLEFSLQTIIYQPPLSSVEGGMLPPAGLSKLQAVRVCGKYSLSGDQLAMRKLGLLNVLAELNVTSELVYPSFVAASVDSNDRVARRGEELLKKKGDRVNLEDPMLISHLFSIFRGTLWNENIAPEARITPASPVLKGKLMSIFMHSVAAANTFPSTLQCIFDCIYGEDTTLKLKQAGMEFTVWVFKHAKNEQLKPMAPIILNGIMKLLDGQNRSETDMISRQLRAFAYQAIGQLGQRAAYLFSNNVGAAVRLFKALKTESLSLRITVQEAVNALSNAYKGCNESIAREVEALLLENIQAEESEARFCTIWWANRVFSFSHCPSRFICMIGISDSRLDIRELAQEGLVPPKDDAGFPSIKDMMDFIYHQQPKLLEPARIGETTLLFPVKTYIAIISFLQKCQDAYCQVNDALQDKASQKAGTSFSGDCFLNILEHAMASNGSIELHAVASSGILEYASKQPQKFGDSYMNRLPWLKQYLSHIDSATRENVAKLLGIVSSQLSADDVASLLEELHSTFQSTERQRFEDAHGAICATGFIVAQCRTGHPTVSNLLLEKVVRGLVKAGQSGNPWLAGAVAEALGHIGLRGDLLFDDSDMLAIMEKVSKAYPFMVRDTASIQSKVDHANEQMPILGKSEGKTQILNAGEVKLAAAWASAIELLTEVVVSKEEKSAQKAAIAFGYLCYGNTNKQLFGIALCALFSLRRSKVEDVLFAVGEALSYIWGGVNITADKILKSNFVSLSKSSSFLSVNAVEGIEMSQQNEDSLEREEARERIVQELFDELLFSTRKEERCAGAVWLLSIVMYCGYHFRVQKMLPEIQEVFSHLLGEQNELTQEMASHGLSLVYELGDTSMKDELVKTLVSTLSGTAKKKRAIKLMDDSEVFEQGSLGEKPGGGNISTYKELCSLANEMGQPDLIYKFMDLANYQASLNSKRGAAFGFAKIAKKAGDALKPYLCQLVPKLIRYQYDPNKHIQDAMGHIWRSLIVEPKKTVDDYFDDIMDDLLSQAGSRLWRSREASSLALCDILLGRKFHEVEKYLERIWAVAFRVVDDIKETVRTAGGSLCRAVSSLSLRLCDSNLTSESDTRAALGIILPFLISRGVSSNVADVRGLSISTVTKLSKNAGSSIRPLLPDLVSCMLEGLSSLEDQRLNYAELHAERIGFSAEKLESVRVAAARESPMWETLEICIQQIDSSTLESLVPRLISLVRSGVGLNTRVGIAKFISLMTDHVAIDIKPYAGSFLKVLFPAIQNERSPTAKHAFSYACATVAKYAGHAQIHLLFEDTVTLCESADKAVQLSGAILLKELSNKANELFKGYHTLILPVVFVSRFDNDKDVCRIFDDVWEENTSSESVALHLYISDIVPFLIKGLSASSWSQKYRNAKAAAKLGDAAGESLAPFVQQILAALIKEIPGRIWEGKEALLDAIAAICKGCSTSVMQQAKSDGVSMDEIIAAVISACGKKKRSFCDAAFTCLEQVLTVFQDQHLFEQVYPFLLDTCNQCISSTSASAESGIPDPDENKLERSASSLELVLACIRASILAAAPCTIAKEGDTIMGCLVGFLRGRHSWQVKQSALSATRAFVKQLKFSQQPDHQQVHITKLLESLCFPVLECITSVKIAQVHIEALECISDMVEFASFRSGLSKETTNMLSTRILELYGIEKNAIAKSLSQNILATLQRDTDNAMHEL